MSSKKRSRGSLADPDPEMAEIPIPPKKTADMTSQFDSAPTTPNIGDISTEQLEEELQRRKTPSTWIRYDIYDSELIKGTNFQVPWIPRKDINPDEIFGHVERWLRSFLSPGLATGRDFGYIMISGASGVGKTRAGLELPLLLSDRFTNCDVLQTFCRAENMAPMPLVDPQPGNSYDKPQPNADLEAKSEDWLALQLASFHLPTLPQHYSPKLQTVLENIRRCRETRENDTLVIFFQIDEFQSRLDSCTHLLCRISSLMASPASPQNPLKATKTFIVPVLSGTWIGKLTLATQPAVLDLVLSGLDNRDDAHRLFLNLLQFRGFNATVPLSTVDNRCHRHILTMLGYIPNMIWLYACEFLRQPCDLDNSDQFSLFWSKLRSTIRSIYCHSLPQFERNHILCLWYFKNTVYLDYKLSPNGPTVGDAMSSGVLFLERNVESPDTFTVVVPLIIASFWNPMFARAFFINPLDQLSPSGFPKFVLAIHHTTYHMMGMQAAIYRELGDLACFRREQRTIEGRSEVRTSIEEIYNHAIIGASSALTRPLWIRPDIKIETVTTFDKDLYALFETYDMAHGADALTPHAAEQYNSSASYSNSGIVDGGSPLTGTKVVDELNKKFFGREFLAIITPKTISGLEFDATQQAFRITHLQSKKLCSELVFSPSTTSTTPGRPALADVCTTLCSRLLVLDTEERLEQFSRGLLSFSSREHMDCAPSTTHTHSMSPL